MAEEKVMRRLTAIVAADVAGYSRLVAADEEGTLSALRGHRRDLIDPKIAEYRGRIANTAGDSLLIEFPSVVEALRCVLDVQRGMVGRNSNLPQDQHITFRVGINLGDVVEQDGDLLGDGVNVAARLEAVADPGGICLSRAARDQVRDRLDIDLEDLGEVQVKNIARPVRAFRVAIDPAEAGAPTRPTQYTTTRNRRLLFGIVGAILVLAVGTIAWIDPWTPRVETASIEAMRLPLPDKPSVVVLPFEVTSSGESDRAFADALNEDLTRGLARVSGLFVIARSSTLSYVGENIAPRRVSEELGVRFVVRASLRRAGNRVRIDAELADTISGRIILSERFDRASNDLFALQDELVETLVSRLAQDLVKTEDQHRFTENVEAYFSWFNGDREAWLNTPTAYGKARALALQALEFEPGFARAKALLAFVETQTAYFKLANDVDGTLVRAHKAAKEVVAAQPDDWYSHSVYAQTMLNLRDYQGAVKAFERAIELEPANAALLTQSTLPLIFLGRGQKAEARLRIAVRLNPFHNWLPDQLLGQATFVQGRYKEALANLANARQKNPRFIGNMWWRAATLGQLGRTHDAQKAVAEILARMPDAAISRSFIQITDDTVMGHFRDGLRGAGLRE